MRKLLILTSAIGLSACAPTSNAVNSDATQSSVTYETAKYFSTSTSNVRVGNFEQDLFGTRYEARVGGRMYDCRYMRTLVTCEYA